MLKTNRKISLNLEIFGPLSERSMYENPFFQWWKCVIMMMMKISALSEAIFNQALTFYPKLS